VLDRAAVGDAGELHDLGRERAPVVRAGNRDGEAGEEDVDQRFVPGPLGELLRAPVAPDRLAEDPDPRPALRERSGDELAIAAKGRPRGLVPLLRVGEADAAGRGAEQRAQRSRVVRRRDDEQCVAPVYTGSDERPRAGCELLGAVVDQRVVVERDVTSSCPSRWSAVTRRALASVDSVSARGLARRPDSICAIADQLSPRRTLDWAPAAVAAPVHEAIARVAAGEQGYAAYPLTFEDARGRLLAAEATLAPLRHDGEIVGLVGVYQRPARAAQGPEEAGFTARQYETLLLLAEGLSTEDIAQRLVLALDTVRNHIRAVFRAAREQ
jgi:DNA-binding CsgD family transcriptional regulator